MSIFQQDEFTSRMVAEWFVQRKGRMPVDVIELMNWLIEFDEIRHRQHLEMEKVFKEHMETCVRSVIVPKDLFG